MLKSKVIPDENPQSVILNETRSLVSDIESVYKSELLSAYSQEQRQSMKKLMSQKTRSKNKKAMKKWCPAVITIRNLLIAVFLSQTIVLIVGSLAVTMNATKQSEAQIQGLRQDKMIESIKNSLSTAPVALNTFKHLFEKVKFNVNDVQDWARALMTVKSVFSDVGSFAYFVTPDGGLRGVLEGFFVFANGMDAHLGIYEMNSDYEVVSYLDSTDFNTNMTYTQWYQSALRIDVNQQIGVWSENPSTPGPFSVIASAPITRKGVFIGAAAIHFELDKFTTILERVANESGSGSLAYIMNAEGDMIAISSNDPTWIEDEHGNRERLKGSENIHNRVVKEVSKHIDRNKSSLKKHGELKAMIKIGKKKYDFAAYEVVDDLGLDWVVVSCLKRRNFVLRVITENWKLLIVILVVSMLAVAAMTLIIYSIVRELRNISMNMSDISEMNISPPTLGKSLNPIHEIKIMKKSVNMMKASLLSFQKYIPVDVVKKIVLSGKQAELGMERRQMSIFFCDIADFTTISEEVDPDVLTFMVGEYFNIVTNTAKNNHGITDKFIGDAVMLLFLDDTEDEFGNIIPNHAIRAVNTSVMCQMQFAKKREEYREKGLREIIVRIGVNSGEALVGNIGSDVRMSYTALGDAVNTASRLEGLNKPFGSCIMIGEATQKLIEGVYLYHWMDSVKVKGKNQAIKIYEPLCLRKDAYKHDEVIHKHLEELKQALLVKRDPELIEDICNTLEYLNESVPDRRSTAVEYTIHRMRERISQIHPNDPESVHLKLFEK